jgi:hypothetical protein
VELLPVALAVLEVVVVLVLAQPVPVVLAQLIKVMMVVKELNNGLDMVLEVEVDLGLLVSIRVLAPVEVMVVLGQHLQLLEHLLSEEEEVVGRGEHPRLPLG